MTSSDLHRILRASQRRPLSMTTETGRTQFPTYQTPPALTPSPSSMEETRSPTPPTASQLCPLETPASVCLLVRLVLSSLDDKFELFFSSVILSLTLFPVSIGGRALASGLTKMQAHEETIVSVDAKAAGKGKVTCSVTTPAGVELDMDVQENRDGTYDIYYTAPEPGKYVITIRFGGQHIPKSPFHVTVSTAGR